MTRRIYSFGYKMNGEDQFATTGPNAPLIIDCRGLWNPHKSAKLRKMSGLDQEVQERVESTAGALDLILRAVEHLATAPSASVAFGCSYGKHRSVALAELTRQRWPDALVIHTGAVAMGKAVR